MNGREDDTMALWRVEVEGERRLARGGVDAGPEALLAPDVTLDGLLTGNRDALRAALDGPDDGGVPPYARVVAPVENQEVWAAGVTYLRSRDARMEESTAPDHYDRVYDAERPELFFKSAGWRVRGPGEPLGIRADSAWDVPEPELGIVVDARGDIVAYVLGNDMSSRSIEGDNPLYLPQAKVYTGSCALGPCIVPVADAPALDELRIELQVTRNGTIMYDEIVDVADLRRTPEELVDWLFRALAFPAGVVLLTGTPIVPPTDFTLRADDAVTVAAVGLGELRNPVETVGGGPEGTSPADARVRSPLPGT